MGLVFHNLPAPRPDVPDSKHPTQSLHLWGYVCVVVGGGGGCQEPELGQAFFWAKREYSESLQELLGGVSGKVPGQALDTQLSPALTHVYLDTPLGTSRTRSHSAAGVTRTLVGALAPHRHTAVCSVPRAILQSREQARPCWLKQRIQKER